MAPKKAVVKEKESPVTVFGFDAELIAQLSKGYPVLVSKNHELVSKNEELTKRDVASKKLINFLKTENARQKAKIELLETETTKYDAKELSKKMAMYEWLKVKTLEQKKEINMLTSKVHRLQSEIKQNEENHQSEVKLLKTQLNQQKEFVLGLQSEIKQNEENHQSEVKLLKTQLNHQKEFVLGADVKNIIDKIKEAHNEVISGMEKIHNLEKSAIRMDAENKGRIILELQKKVQDLNAQN